MLKSHCLLEVTLGICGRWSTTTSRSQRLIGLRSECPSFSNHDGVLLRSMPLHSQQTLERPMSETPFEHAGSLRIGTVDFVSPDEVKVLLDIEAPDSVALNAGAPRPFPRVNGYVLIPVDDGFVVGQIEWLTVERSTFPKRRGMQDFGLVDLPYPLRRMSLSPLGNLRKKASPAADYVFRRGADSLPSIGTGVLLPTEKQLRSIVESGERRRVKIGTSPLAAHAEVRVDPDPNIWPSPCSIRKYRQRQRHLICHKRQCSDGSEHIYIR